MLTERWRIHFNTVRPHSSLGYRPPVPEAWMAKTARREEMALATLLPSLPAESCNDPKQQIVALH